MIVKSEKIPSPIGPETSFIRSRMRLKFSLRPPREDSAVDCRPALVFTKNREELSRFGWTVLRFGEGELKENEQGVKKTLSAYVYKLWRNAKKVQDKAAKEQGQGKAAARVPGHLYLQSFQLHPEMDTIRMALEDGDDLKGMLKATGEATEPQDERELEKTLAHAGKDGWKADQGPGDTVGGDVRGEVGLSKEGVRGSGRPK